MSANDILDVLNIQRDDARQPAKKKAKTSADGSGQPRQTGMARELYSLLGPNTPPVNLLNSSNSATKDKWKTKATPWTRQEFKPAPDGNDITLYHWVRGSKELLEQEASQNQPYFFSKFNTNIDIPQFVDEKTYDKFMEEIKENIIREKEIKAQREKERKERELERKKEKERLEKEKLEKQEAEGKNKENGTKSSDKDSKSDEKTTSNESKESSVRAPDHSEPEPEPEQEPEEWTYEETEYLFGLCKSFELKWHIIYDRYNFGTNRSIEDLKEQFYRICKYIYVNDANGNPSLIESLGSFNKSKETERKQYLERLLKRTPAEIAEEESLVIEARRFELAAKKMLTERANLLTLLDSPQTSQSVQQYQSSQGLANLYNNLMIMDKNQKKRQLQSQGTSSHDPIPPPIPLAASSSIRKERSFQSHLQQYLSSLVKQNQSQTQNKNELSSVQKLLMKRLTPKEEEAFGLHYHANEKLALGVILRSSQRLPGLQQRQSVLKSVTSIFTELDIPTAGGTSFKPAMPTRKTMAKYDELLRAVVALLDVKKGRDKLEAEIELIRSQRGLQ